ncbi:MAG TPA: DUF2254 domain-containing protein [Edaphobacter sp.]|nr:DUF2254 domain-containing protein [Edaphobacter sp.]
MRARLNRLIEILQTNFWFVPLIMLSLSGALAIALLAVDQRYDPGVNSNLGWAYSGGPEGARSLLSTIAGSMITAASVTFSLASVALSIASQQYGSRVLRNFMRDKITQILLGTFVSTFLYSVLVVRAIRGTSEAEGFVPAISITVGIVLSVFSLVLLVYFIHHVSASIQASHIVNVIAEDLEKAIPALYPSESGKPAPDSEDNRFRQRSCTILLSTRSGYLQSLDLDRLLEVACDLDLVVEILPAPGDHLVHDDPLAKLWGATNLAEEKTERIRAAFFVGGERTPLQDIRYQFQQLADVVIRALSPGINDPFTAVNGIDKIASGISVLSKRPRVAERRSDQDGTLRLIVSPPDLSCVLRETVSHIAVYAAADQFVMAGLRRVLNVAERNQQQPQEQQTILQLREELNRLERNASGHYV